MHHHSLTGTLLATLALLSGCATSPAEAPPGVKPVHMARLVDQPTPACADEADSSKSCYVYVKAEPDSTSGCALTLPARFEVVGKNGPRTMIWVLTGDTLWYTFRFDGIEVKDDPQQQDMVLAPNRWSEKVLVVRNYRKTARDLTYLLKVSVQRRFGEFSSCDLEAVVVNKG